MLVKDQAICIRTTDFSETSQIVTFFTREHGKIGAIAKGAKRTKSSFGGALEVYAYGPVVYQDAAQGGLNTLREFEPRHDIVAGLSRHMYAYYCSLMAGELLTKLTHEHDAHPGLFDSFLGFLQRLSVADQAGLPGKAILTQHEALGMLLLFLPNLLAEIGLQLHLDSCGNCRTPQENECQDVYFSSDLSSLICRDCEASYPERLALTPGVRACLRSPYQVADADKTTVREAVRLLVSHFTHLLHQRPKTAKYVLGWTGPGTPGG